MSPQQFWIRVRIKNGGQVIDMHAPVAFAMIDGGTADRIDEQGRKVNRDGSPIASAPVETAAKNTKPVEKAAHVNAPQRGQQQNFRRTPTNAR